MMTNERRSLVVDEMFYLYNGLVLVLANIAGFTGYPMEPGTYLALAMMLDTAAGVALSIRKTRDFSSSRLAEGIIGKLLILAIPLGISIMVKTLGKDFEYLLTAAITALIISEVYSFISNVHCYHKGQKLPEIDGISAIGRMISELFKLKRDHKDGR